MARILKSTVFGTYNNASYGRVVILPNSTPSISITSTTRELPSSVVISQTFVWRSYLSWTLSIFAVSTASFTCLLLFFFFLDHSYLLNPTAVFVLPTPYISGISCDGHSKEGMACMSSMESQSAVNSLCMPVKYEPWPFAKFSLIYQNGLACLLSHPVSPTWPKVVSHHLYSLLFAQLCSTFLEHQSRKSIGLKHSQQEIAKKLMVMLLEWGGNLRSVYYFWG